MPTIRTKERRASVRMPGSHPAMLSDAKGRMIGRGRTGNISESGVFVLVPGGRNVQIGATLRIQLELPRSPDHPRMKRRVLYNARVVRVEPMGEWRGVGLELLDKIE